MGSPQDIQSLLRFLSQDAKVPLAQAMGKVKDLQSAKLITPSEIAKSGFGHLRAVFGDEKLARQVLNAAKRVSKKRAADEASVPSGPPAPAKKAKSAPNGEPPDPAAFEASLALPEAEMDEAKLKDVLVHTNRAPLLLAFVVSLLKYTMPQQPISSRLSLAQAVVSANSNSKAKYLGIQNGRTAEEEGWGEGQPLIKVMGRDIRVMKRWGYTWKDDDHDDASSQVTLQDSTQDTVMVESSIHDEPALWGVDLEAMKKTNGPVTFGARKTSTSELPIYRPESARAYLLKSFETRPPPGERGKKTPAEKGQNLGMLLGALELLYQSWSRILSKEDLDKRAWSWYANVRPEVKAGIAGWGGKGNVNLADILEMRRPVG